MIVIKTSENVPKVEESKVRRHFDEVRQKWEFSVVDIIGLTTSSSDPRNYWKVLKNRLKKAQNKLVTQCNQLKLVASDGKLYLTDVADVDALLSILSLIPNSNAATFRTLLSHIGAPLPEEKTVLSSLPPLDEVSEIADFSSFREVEGESELLIDGYHTEHQVVIEAMVAGVAPEDIKISLGGEKINISGVKKNPDQSNESEKDYFCQELYWTTFSRTIVLPFAVQKENIQMSEDHGRLTIKLLKI